MEIEVAKARNSTTERMCPDCQGTGAYEVPHHNPQFDTFRDCPRFDCVGGWIRWAPVDPLDQLAHVRIRPAYRSHLYKNLRARAYLPVTLPKDPAPRVVSEAERDQRAALQNHEFVMGHFNRVMGIAA